MTMHVVRHAFVHTLGSQPNSRSLRFRLSASFRSQGCGPRPAA